jgi:hypothetical protein
MQAPMLGWPPNFGFVVEDRDNRSPLAGPVRRPDSRRVGDFVRIVPPPGIRCATPPVTPKRH